MAMLGDLASGRDPLSTILVDGLAILVGAPLVPGLAHSLCTCRAGAQITAALAARNIVRFDTGRNLDKGLFDRLQGELEAREKSPGLSTSNLLTLPEPLSSPLHWMIRQGPVVLADIEMPELY